MSIVETMSGRAVAALAAFVAAGGATIAGVLL